MEQDNMALGYAMGRDNSNGNGMFGGDWMAMWFILALLGFGNNGGWGIGNNGGNSMLGYEIGRAATQADVASGFSTSEIMSDLNDILVGQAQSFAGVQQTLCQGFNGIDRAIADCSCQTQRSIDSVNFNMERNKCDIIQAYERGNQRIIDWLACKENQALRDEVLENRFANMLSKQSRYILDETMPRPRPAYPACNPNLPVNYNGWNGFNNGNCNNCNNCNNW